MARSRGNQATHAMNGHEKAKVDDQPFVVRLSAWFVLVCFLCASTLAFAVGRLAVTLFLHKHPIGAVLYADGTVKALPPPLFSEKKPIPHTVYSSKHFATPGVATSDNLLARRPGINDPSELGQLQQKDVYMDGNTPESLDGDDEEVHEPAGQHLLIDIRNVDGVFLNSDDRLARAMVDLIEMSGLTMLSYHCHGLEPIGVSCVGVLLESHISFHTWPIPGVILLDLFTCGPKPLLPLLPIIEKLFGVPKEQVFPEQEIEKPYMRWAHKRRGFRAESGNPEESVDMHQHVLGLIDLDMKELVVSEESPFQTLDILDVINPRFLSLENYHKSLENDGSYYALHPEFFRPERVVFLDGIMQSRLRGEAAYHEVLVHPAMFAHENPKRVAIIGGGEGATLREVLKHVSVEKVTMIEIDEMVVSMSRKYIPEWNDCSNLVGSAKSCFDDLRAEIVCTDAIAWFMDHYSDQQKTQSKDLYDIVIMDALDPSSIVEFSDILYNNNALAKSISNALGTNGILVAQLGETSRIDHPTQHKGMQAEDSFFGHLVHQGFQLLTQYQEAHGNFMATWKFLAAFKNRATFSNWNSNQAEFNALIHDRISQTYSGEPALRFFDGATMMTLQYPDRAMEEVFCRKQPIPFLCNERHGFDPEFSNSPIYSFDVKRSSTSRDGSGLFTNSFVPKNSVIAIDEDVQDVSVMPRTARLLQKFGSTDPTGKWRAFHPYMEKYPNYYYGKAEYSLVTGKKHFINHGCKGTFNILPLISPIIFSESTVRPDNIPQDLLRSELYSVAYNTAIRRSHLIYRNPVTFATRDIQHGEELLQNELNKLSKESWEHSVLHLQEICESEAYDENLPVVNDAAAETSMV